MARPAVIFKGTMDGLVIVLDEEADLPQIMSCLAEKMETARHFLQGARVYVELGERNISLAEAKELAKLLQGRRGLQVMGFQRNKQRVKALDEVIANDTSLAPEQGAGGKPRVKLIDKGLEPLAPSGGKKPSRPRTKTEGYTLFIYHTLRSGQSVRYEGSVVIVGDVNPGAEVIAGGDIVVMGALRGMAHAGAAGDDRAIVAAQWLQPTQLRIADVFTRSPDEDIPAPRIPEVALLQEGTIVIDRYFTLGERLRSNTEEANEEEREEWQWAE